MFSVECQILSTIETILKTFQSAPDLLALGEMQTNWHLIIFSLIQIVKKLTTHVKWQILGAQILFSPEQVQSIPYSSDSQPGCPELVLGVPPIVTFTWSCIPVKLARGVAKYMKYLVSVPRTKKGWETLPYRVD